MVKKAKELKIGGRNKSSPYLVWVTSNSGHWLKIENSYQVVFITQPLHDRCGFSYAAALKLLSLVVLVLVDARLEFSVTCITETWEDVTLLLNTSQDIAVRTCSITKHEHNNVFSSPLSMRHRSRLKTPGRLGGSRTNPGVLMITKKQHRSHIMTVSKSAIS